ncbi:MBL fold metallo-hydrolase [Rubrobacter marinus]|uniref:MBL fold metallo-hydrolase n=1 Tax=Rubrobacter marinus TaxID=2653852 RepID=A0A6G8Q202_9ACTN|nr:MBL fold metallo-hydrolase [Rubrobacter marinus]QIN80514.1 MBL fold metallo-hydrolase [Rubrobacter marinus]
MAEDKRPELVAEGVYRVDAIGLSNAINMLLLENDDGWTLVDTGVGSSAGRVRGALEALGSGPEDLKRIFITHHHDDHTGGLKGILEWAPRAEVGATPHEAEVISGRRALDPQSNAFLRYMSRGAEPPSVPVGKVLREGDLVSGFRLISTPGHTLGHVSLLRDADGLLFTADAFGRLPLKLRVGVRKAFCADPPLARSSAAKLLGEEFATVILAHGSVMRSGARATLRAAVDRCKY